MYAEALTIARSLGDEWGATILLNNLGVLSGMRGEYADARELSLESLAIARTRRDEINAAIALDNLGEVDTRTRPSSRPAATSRRASRSSGASATGRARPRRCGRSATSRGSAATTRPRAAATRRRSRSGARPATCASSGSSTRRQSSWRSIPATTPRRGDFCTLHADAPRLGEQRYLAHAIEALGALPPRAATPTRRSRWRPPRPRCATRSARRARRSIRRASTGGLRQLGHADPRGRQSAWSLGAVAPIGELIDCLPGAHRTGSSGIRTR